MSTVNRRVLPGLGLGLGYTLSYLTILVLIPLGFCFWTAAELSWNDFWKAVADPKAIAAYRLTFAASFLAGAVNVAFGLMVAWTLVRYEFPGKRIIDALVDIPFALPTAVAGMIYANLYMPEGWLGRFLVPLGVEGAFSRTGIVLVLIFTGFPFVVRTVQPVLEDLDAETEEAAGVLGASRWQTFRRVILPSLIPPAITGFSLAFARAIGEYGSVVFISANTPETTIAPMRIVALQLESTNADRASATAEAAAIASVLLLVSFAMLILINLFERWNRRYGQ